jgi:hypothetical protein
MNAEQNKNGHGAQAAPGRSGGRAMSTSALAAACTAIPTIRAAGARAAPRLLCITVSCIVTCMPTPFRNCPCRPGYSCRTVHPLSHEAGRRPDMIRLSR